MIIKNLNTVENGVDIVHANIPDNLGELYTILRPLLKRYFSSQIVFGDAYHREFHTDLNIKNFIHSFCEFYLGRNTRYGFRNTEELARLYDCVVSDTAERDIKEVLSIFRAALVHAVGKLSYGFTSTLQSQFVYDFISKISTFEIIETMAPGGGDVNIMSGEQ